VGQPVTITWQALGGREWQGKVEQMPSSIEPLGSRQVGQVVCIIENPGRDLIPGTNVDAVIRTGVVENALVIPKEALRHDHDGDFVFLVKNGVIERRPVKTGNTSVTQVQITQGLSDAENVVLPGEVPLQPGQKVATPAG
jgi:RND family efflux transporter MFP subunit